MMIVIFLVKLFKKNINCKHNQQYNYLSENLEKIFSNGTHLIESMLPIKEHGLKSKKLDSKSKKSDSNSNSDSDEDN